jgi:hypothetical protein
MENSFRDWLLKNELVDTFGPGDPEDMASMIRKSGGGAMLTGKAPSKPWDGPGGITTPRPSVPKPWTQNNRRRIISITPKASFIAKPPAFK